MAQLVKQFTVGIFGALVLGVSTPGVCAEQGVEHVPGPVLPRIQLID